MYEFGDAMKALEASVDVRRRIWAPGWWYRILPATERTVRRLVCVRIDEFGEERISGDATFTIDDVGANDWVWANPKTRCSSVLEHPIWDTVRVHFGERPHELRGLEVRNLPRALSLRLQGLELECCACGRMIKVFRQRKGSRWSELYFSPACPSAQSPGCSRGNECRDEVDRIRESLKGNPVPRPQLDLFAGAR